MIDGGVEECMSDIRLGTPDSGLEIDAEEKRRGRERGRDGEWIFESSETRQSNALLA